MIEHIDIHTPQEYVDEMSCSPNDEALKNLKRVHGQIAGVIRMYEEERSCLEIVQQIVAVRSALSSIAKGMLAGEASRCAKQSSSQDFDRVLKSLIELT